MRNALDLALRLGLGIETGTSYLNLGEMTAVCEVIATGLDLVDAGRDFARSRGLTHHEMWSRAGRLWALYELGRWDELFEESDVLLRWDRDQGGTQIEVNVLMSRAPARAQRGDIAGAVHDASIFVPRARAIGDPQSAAPALVWAALVHAMDGRTGEAVSFVREFEDRTRGHPNRRATRLAPLVRVCVSAGELALGEALVDGARDAPATHVVRAAIATATATLAQARADLASAAASYREAVGHWGDWGSVVERGYALLGLGHCAGDADALREGNAIFEDLGAVPFVSRAA
jgi:hypothetical protein